MRMTEKHSLIVSRNYTCSEK